MKTITKNEKMVLKAMIENAKSVGDNGVEFWLEDVANICGLSFASVRGTAGSLRNKGLIYCYNGDCCFDGEVLPEGFAQISENSEIENQENNGIDSRIARMNEIKAIKLSTISKKRRESVKLAKNLIDNLILPYWNIIEDENNVGLKYILANPYMEGQDELMEIVKSRYDELLAAEKAKETKRKSETSIADSSSIKSVNTMAENRKSVSKRKIGDRHPKYPDLVWVEYMPGRFDWRHKKNAIKYGVIRSVEEILKTTPSEPLTDDEKAIFVALESGFRLTDEETESPLQGCIVSPASNKTTFISLVTAADLFHKLGVTREELKQFHI